MNFTLYASIKSRSPFLFFELEKAVEHWYYEDKSWIADYTPARNTLQWSVQNCSNKSKLPGFVRSKNWNSLAHTFTPYSTTCIPWSVVEKKRNRYTVPRKNTNMLRKSIKMDGYFLHSVKVLTKAVPFATQIAIRQDTNNTNICKSCVNDLHDQILAIRLVQGLLYTGSEGFRQWVLKLKHI